jgi:hypothetical protein
LWRRTRFEITRSLKLDHGIDVIDEGMDRCA